MEAWLSALPEDAGETLRRADALCENFEKGASPEEALSLWRDFLKGCRAAERAASAAAELSELDGSVKQAASALDELDKKIRKLADDSKDIGPAANITLKGAEAAAFINEWGATATLPGQLPQSRSGTGYAGPPPAPAAPGLPRPSVPPIDRTPSPPASSRTAVRSASRRSPYR